MLHGLARSLKITLHSSQYSTAKDRLSTSVSCFGNGCSFNQRLGTLTATLAGWNIIWNNMLLLYNMLVHVLYNMILKIYCVLIKIYHLYQWNAENFGPSIYCKALLSIPQKITCILFHGCCDVIMCRISNRSNRVMYYLCKQPFTSKRAPGILRLCRQTGHLILILKNNCQQVILF